MHSLKQLINESVSRYCHIWKASDGKYYMDLASREYGDYEDATTYGPFADDEKAMDYLDNFANPGGWSQDDSGTRPPPKKSPNGRPVERTGGGSSYGGSMWGSGGFSSSARDYFMRPVEKPKAAAPPPKPAAKPAAPPVAKKPEPAKPVKGGKKTTYKIYNGTGTGKAVTGSSPIHTRIKGKVYAPTVISKFRPGQAAAVEPEGDELKVSDPATGHTQRWTKRESIERVILDMIELLDS